jgi:hypothetical protein
MAGIKIDGKEIAQSVKDRVKAAVDELTSRRQSSVCHIC